nr:LacI family DNA-binding transcriptional regulator [Homoserinibacter gongjuensis]
MLNDLPNVRPATRARVEQAIAQLRYSPSPRLARSSRGARERSDSSRPASPTTARARSRCTSTSPPGPPATTSRP